MMNSINGPSQVTPRRLALSPYATLGFALYPFAGPSAWITFLPPCESTVPPPPSLRPCSQSLLQEAPHLQGSPAWGACLPQSPSPNPSRLLLPLVTRVIISWLVLVQHQSFLDVGAVPQRGVFTHILRLFWGEKQRAGLG